MNLEPFCTYLLQAYSQKGYMYDEAKTFCSMLIKSGIFKDDDFENTEKVARLFYGKGHSIARAKFHRRKTLIKELYGWLMQQGKVSPQFLAEIETFDCGDPILPTELWRYSFASLEDAVGYVTRVGQYRSVGGENVLLFHKAVVVLAWYQVNLSEMPLIYKSDLNIENKTLQVRGANPRVITLDETSAQLLKLFADTVCYNGLEGRQMKYQSSEYLFRSDRSRHLDTNGIKCQLKRFNDHVEKLGTGRELSVPQISKCRLFYETYKRSMESDASANSVIQALEGCDRAMASGRVRTYYVWKKLFYDTKEVI